MKIAHLLSSLAVGGQERVVVDLASGQMARGHDVMVVSLAPRPEGPLADELRERGVDVLTVPKRPGFDPWLAPRLAAALARRGVRLLHTHNPQPLVYGGAAALFARVALVHTKHGANLGPGSALRLRRIAGLVPRVFVAVSRPTAALARELHECPPERIAIVENGIDLARFGPDTDAGRAARAALGLPLDGWVVGTVGRLVVEKDQPALVEAAAPLLRGGARLVVVGDGPERGAIEARATALGVRERVVTTGQRGDVASMLRALDVFALSSRTEGLPLVLIEAMATSLPVVATAVGGVASVVEHEATGLLAPPGDPGALGQALATLAADPARARAMGARGRTRALAMGSADRMVDAYLALYERALDGRPASPDEVPA